MQDEPRNRNMTADVEKVEEELRNIEEVVKKYEQEEPGGEMGDDEMVSEIPG